MRTCHLVLVLPLLAVTAFAQGDKSKEKPKSMILVIDMLRAIDESDEGRAVIATLKQEMAAQKQRYTEEKAKLQEKVKVLLAAKAADRTPEYYKDLEQAMRKNADIEMENNLFMAKRGDELNRATQQLLQGVQQEARAVMKKRGAEMVLMTRTGPIELATDQDQQQELLMRRVLCYEDSVDITAEVIQRMNEWYQKNKSAQGPPKREGEGAAAGDGKAAKEEAPKGTAQAGG
jgi:Skp family chaperone for outer membrane proteins